MPQERRKGKARVKRKKKPKPSKGSKGARAYLEGKRETEQIKKQKIEDAVQSIVDWKRGRRRNEMPGSLHNPGVRPGGSGTKPVYPPKKPSKK